MKKRTVVAVGAAASVGIAAARARRALDGTAPQTGTFPNGMAYARGGGPKTMLWLPGGPGMGVPTGPMRMMMGRNLRPYTEAGYSVWFVTRRRDMPVGHTMEDMAVAYAEVIRTSFGGAVDAVVGVSNGGLVAQYLAANHPGLARRVVLAVSAARMTTRGRDLDYRWALACGGPTRRGGAGDRGDRAARSRSAATAPGPGACARCSLPQ